MEQQMSKSNLKQLMPNYKHKEFVLTRLEIQTSTRYSKNYEENNQNNIFCELK